MKLKKGEKRRRRRNSKGYRGRKRDCTEGRKEEWVKEVRYLKNYENFHLGFVIKIMIKKGFNENTCWSDLVGIKPRLKKILLFLTRIIYDFF